MFESHMWDDGADIVVSTPKQESSFHRVLFRSFSLLFFVTSLLFLCVFYLFIVLR